MNAESTPRAHAPPSVPGSYRLCTACVPPPLYRRCEDDLTHKLAEILRTNQAIKRQDASGTPQHVIQEQVLALQYHITTYLDNTSPGGAYGRWDIVAAAPRAAGGPALRGCACRKPCQLAWPSLRAAHLALLACTHACTYACVSRSYACMHAWYAI